MQRIACRVIYERHPVVDQELRAVITEIVLRLDDQDLEHHNGIEGGPPALGAIAVIQRSDEIGPENLEVHNRSIGLKLVTDIAQPP